MVRCCHRHQTSQPTQALAQQPLLLLLLLLVVLAEGWDAKASPAGCHHQRSQPMLVTLEQLLLHHLLPVVTALQERQQ
jgi:hypothetical protein